ncbi:MAG TPA: HAD-IA family hydrolase [Acidimicrobiales bacterium]|nr:HAD-IA family hydrolase [Acidimicrobiales bacterium]
MSLRALVFDFDGLILDTEWSAFSTAASVWAEHGLELDLDVWQQIVGTAEHPHWSDMLETDLGRAIDREVVVAARQAQHHAEVEAMDLQPGVEALVRAAEVAGLALAVASSSPRYWVEGHLERRGLAPSFRAVVCREDVERTKPDPALYRTALDRLGVGPDEAVALEDSHHGTVAARAAGLPVVAVPNRVTAGQDFRPATLVVDSLEQVTLPALRELVGR